MRSPRPLLLLGAAVLMLVGAACSSASRPSTATEKGTPGGAPSGAPYRVAIVADLSGAASTLSGPAAVGMQTAFQAIRDHGGPDGHRIDVTVFDSQSTAAGAQTAVQQALAEKPDVIAPAMLSSNLAGVVPVLQSAKIPVVSSVSLPDLVAPNSSAPWFFAMGSYQPQSALGYLLGMKQILGDLKGLRIATSPTNTAGSAAVVKVFKQLAEREGAQVVQNEVIPISGFTSYASQAASLVSNHVDAVMTVGRSSDLAVIVPALRTAGFRGKVFGGEGSADDALFSRLADPGYYAGRVYSTPQPGDLISQAAQRYNEPSTGSQFEAGWAQAYVIAAGLTACGSPCEQPKFTSGLESGGELKIPGDPAFTPVKFGPNKHFALTSNQFVVWDAAKKAVVPAGPPVNVSDLSAVPAL